MNEEELIATIALTRIPGIGPINAKILMHTMGSALAVFQYKNEIQGLSPVVEERLMRALDCPETLLRAEKELLFVQKNHIDCLSVNDEAYPSRLRECDDAPILLYFRGNTDLNTQRILNMVGTRKATDYGKRLCVEFLSELKELLPDILVISGLAYGIDICAHRAALASQFDTVGVLAHGLDRIYPSAHRKTAIDMLEHGGLLTEYMSETNPDRQNFICRNRIVAGMSDATIVVESAAKGGALITADIAGSYHRDCFAFPGRINDEFSRGCNNLINGNKAQLIQSAEDFVKAMCWDIDVPEHRPMPVQRDLFPDLTEDEQLIVTILRKDGEMQINTLVVVADIPVNKVNAILFELEMKGVVRALAGGMYQLLS